MISVCITTYNGENYIKEQIDSILPQLGAGDEVIVSDDGSTDRTLDLIRAYRDERIHICANEGAHGYTPNFENALRHAKGDYIFLSDQDDVWMPDKVARCMEMMQTCDFVASNARVVDSVLQQLYPSFFALRHSRHGLLNNVIKFSYLGCCLCFRRCVVEYALPFPRNHRLCTHDNWLTLVALFFFRAKVTDECLILYRRHTNNESGGGIVNSTSLSFKLRYRIYLLVNILKVFVKKRLTLRG